MEDPGSKPLKRGTASGLGGAFGLLAGASLFFLSYLVHLRAPNLPHYAAEMFGVVVAVSVFMLTWNGREFLDNHYFLFLGIGCLFVGVLDALHALAFDGWIGGGGRNVDVQLWYAARFFQGVVLAMAPWFVDRKIRSGATLAVMGAAAALLFAVVSGGMVRDWFDHGRHAGFMAASDIALVGLGAAAYAGLRGKRKWFEGTMFNWLAASVVLAVVSGTAEGMGMRGYEGLFLVGDLFMALSFYLIYKAIIETGLRRPYELLFQNLKRSKEEALAARRELEVRVAERTAELRGVNERLERELAERKATEQERETTIELLRRVNTARSINELVAGLAAFLRERIGCESVGIRYRIGSGFPFLGDPGSVDGYVRSGIELCPAAGEGDPVDAELPVPTRPCVCGAIVPGGAPPGEPRFRGERAFWTNSVSALLADRARSGEDVVRDRCRREAFESLALVPLRGGEETFGFLQFCDRRKGRFTPEGMAMLERVAGHVAAAVSQQLAKEALRESEDRFRSLVENVPVGILIVRNGRVVFRNPSACRLFGKIPEPVRFRDIGTAFLEDAGKFERLCGAVESEAEGIRETDIRFFVPEAEIERSTLRWVYFQVERIEYQGRMASLVVLNDLTRMKDLEQIVSTREKLSIIGQMASGIAHEIRNPLSGININISTLEHVIRNLEGASPQERGRAHEIVSQARAASIKIADVIRRVMEFSKQTPPRLERIDVNRVVRDAMAFSSATLRKHGIVVEESLSPGLPGCNADARLLEQVLLNLITNAVQAMEGTHRAKRLGLATGQDGSGVLIRVSDSGPGVPPDLRERIFDPFHTTRETGHGIGLSFSRRVIENHGGTLSAAESRWEGAEFRIRLPAEPQGSPA